MIGSIVLDAMTASERGNASDYNVKGRWAWIDTTQWDSVTTAGVLQSGGGTHMALLRDSTDKSWVLHWHGGSHARLWRADSMQVSTLGIHVPTDSGFNAFCSGHAVMADGRLMVAGGTLTGITGEQRVSIFNVNRIDSIHCGWTFVDTLDHGRWYPTVTTLGDGKVLATSGVQFMKMQMFGGRETDGTESFMNDARVLDLGKRLPWESDQTPASPRPAERHGHSANWYFPTGVTHVFGGLVEGGAVDTVTNVVWRLYLYDNDYGQKWSWDNPVTLGDANYQTEYQGRPRPRHRHTAALVDSSLFIYGGIGKDGGGNDVVLDDLWRLNLVTLQWTKFNVAGGPGARYGHTMVADSLEKPASGNHEPVLLAYGGRSSASSYADGDVWVLRVNASQGELPPSWRHVTPAGSTPGQREGHVAVMDHPRDHRMVMMGGDRSSGGLGNDVWELKPDSDWKWTNLSPGSGSTPAARTRHAAIYDSQWERLLVFGGDTNTGSGGEVADLWSLPMNVGSPTWEQQWHGSAPAARQGHAMVFDARGHHVKVPERYSAGSNSWEQFTGAPRWQTDYPFMHLLRNGKLLYGGNGPDDRDTSAVFAPSGPAWTNLTKSGFLGGSSVMTGASADTVMKFGANDEGSTLSGAGRYATIDSTSGATSWTETGALPEGYKRRYHNLTIVPDGRVLLTGGHSSDEKSQVDGKFIYGLTPFFYKSTTWEATHLADDLVRRSYHSTALLLPDARVLCASGLPVDDTLHATVYSPPYLYSSGTTLATRPFVTSMPGYTPFHYGEPLWVGVDAASISAISIVSLMRAGSVTHSFDQNQRYIRPLFTKDVAKKRMRVLIPPNPNHVPPGDYMLFAVRSDGVPWVAKWIRVEAETDVTAPAATSDLEVAVNGSTAYFFWTAQGDDGTGPRTARGHELRYSTSTITESNWSSATLAQVGGPKPAGEVEIAGVLGLDCGTYYAAVKTFDEQGNYSGLSNVAQFTACGGGGDLQSRRTDGGALRSEHATGIVPPAASVGVVRVGREAGRDASIQLVNIGSSPLAIDSLAMVLAETSGNSVALVAQGTLGLAARAAADNVRSSLAGDLTARIAGGYTTAAGETLVVETGGQVTQLIIGASASAASEPSTSGITIEVRAGDAWKHAGEWHPGEGRGSWIANVAGDSMRLMFRSRYEIHELGLLTPTSNTPAVRSLARAEFEHSRLGTLEAGAGSAAAPITLLPGEQVQVGFAEAAGGVPGSPFIALRARPLGAAEPARSTATLRLPVQFSLGQNEPNPFGAGTLIRFELPRRARVDLEVFDVHGRRIKQLARGEWPAGYHALEWNGGDAAGRRVGAGVYLYRMTAGSFTKSRKLVVLP